MAAEHDQVASDFAADAGIAVQHHHLAGRFAVKPKILAQGDHPIANDAAFRDLVGGRLHGRILGQGAGGKP